mgnify:FL=1
MGDFTYIIDNLDLKNARNMFKKFEYMLNAILYSLYCGRVHSIKRQNQIVYKTFLSALRLPFLSRWKNQLGPLIAKNMKASESNLYNKRASTSIGMAIHMFGYFYSGYPSLVSLIFAGESIRVLHKFDLLVVVLAIGIPIGICYIPAYKAVFSNDRYLKYFQQFERENEAWHKKWKRKTFFFCMGSVIVTLLGMVAAFTIAILL